MAYRYIIRPLRRQFILFRSFQLAKSLHGNFRHRFMIQWKIHLPAHKALHPYHLSARAKLNGKRLFLTNNKTRNFRVAKAILFCCFKNSHTILVHIVFHYDSSYIKPFAKSSLSLSVSACTTGLGWASVSISIERFP